MWWDSDDWMLRGRDFELSLFRVRGLALALWWGGEERKLKLHVSVPFLLNLFAPLPWTPSMRKPTTAEGPVWSYGVSVHSDTIHLNRGWGAKVYWWPWSGSRNYRTVPLWHQTANLFDPYTGKIVQAKIKVSQDDRWYWWGLRRKRTYSAWAELAEEVGPRINTWKGGVLGFGVRLESRREKRSSVLLKLQRRIYDL